MTHYKRGEIVLVPFPFTDLSGRRQRPALVVSPDGFHPEDLVVCAITSRLPQQLSPWELPLDSLDLVDRRLARPSVVQVGKLFTLHHSLVRARFGALLPLKRAEVMERLRALFAAPAS